MERSNDRRKSPRSGRGNVDAQNRHLAQQAGLDRDLESQVPPLCGRITATILAVILALLIVVSIWIMV
jgi:hypothetical protein